MTNENERFENLMDPDDVDFDNDPAMVALREAARKDRLTGETTDGLVLPGMSKALTPKQERIADALRKEQGLGPELVRREAQIQVNIHILPGTREVLRKYAEEMGYWHNGHGNLSALLDLIGTGKLIIIDPTKDA